MTTHRAAQGSVSTTEPITNRPEVSFDSSDPQHAEAYLGTAFGSTVKISDDPETFKYRITRLICGAVQFSTIEHTATVDARVDALFGVLRMHWGVRADHISGERLGPGDIAVNGQPGQQQHVRYTPSSFTLVVLPMQTLAAAAQDRPDDDLKPLRFHSLHPTRPAASGQWLRTVDYITKSMHACPDGPGQPLLAGAASRMLTATLLTTFPNTWTTEPHYQDRTDATPTALARAIAFIEANADVDITILDIARAAYVTVRAVQLAFRRQLDTTPLQYLRRVRLDRAHNELRAANPGDGNTVIHVAARWGFADASRFAALYRRTYGQPPSHTLRT
jgi:AraC-like DNA-binding protein